MPVNEDKSKDNISSILKQKSSFILRYGISIIVFIFLIFMIIIGGFYFSNKNVKVHMLNTKLLEIRYVAKTKSQESHSMVLFIEAKSKDVAGINLEEEAVMLKNQKCNNEIPVIIKDVFYTFKNISTPQTVKIVLNIAEEDYMKSCKNLSQGDFIDIKLKSSLGSDYKLF